MIENLIVALMVLSAAVYALKRYAPQWLIRKSGAWLASSAAALGLQRLSKTMVQSWVVASPSGKSCGSGCGGCGGCGAGDVAGGAANASAPPAPALTPISPHSNQHAVIKIHQRKSTKSMR